MPTLNYHHLLHFWTVAREGGVAAAGRRLRLSQSTLSTQMRLLEEQMGLTLFDRSGGRLTLSEAGRTAFRYADEIFGLGREMVDALHSRPEGHPLRLAVGITDAVQKLIAYRLIEPALKLPGGLQVQCSEDRLDRLLPLLASHELDLVISDVPLQPGASFKAFNHPLGHSDISIFAVPEQAARLRLDPGAAPRRRPHPPRARARPRRLQRGHGLRPRRRPHPGHLRRHHPLLHPRPHHERRLLRRAQRLAPAHRPSGSWRLP